MVEKIIKHFYKDRFLLLLSLIVGLMLTLFTQVTQAYSENIHDGFENNLIRFHVIANSDSPEDQALKLLVRDAVLEEMRPLLEQSSNIEESRNLLNENKDIITEISQCIINENKKDYDVTAMVEKVYFPTKQYGDVVLPAGEYEALRIVIGEGGGKNWWCVMFPPLCFVDITHGIVPNETKQELKKVLTEEEYDIISLQTSEDILDIKIKFKIVEWWQGRDEKNNEK